MALIQICEPGQTPEPHAGDVVPAVGIDLGTTNAVVAVSRNNVPEILRGDDGSALVPSVVAYAQDGSAVVGALARQLLPERPEAVIGSVKRLMGRGIDDVKPLLGTLPYDIEPAGEGDDKMVRLRIGGHLRNPVQVSADILTALRARAEAQLGGTVTRAVVTVPAYFDDAGRTATKDAARLAGLEVLRLVNEPTAAALAYGLDRQAEGLYAVYDLGGGTFDISILHMERGVFQVRATGGDAALGGDDFDHAIAETFLEERGQAEEVMSSGDVKRALMTARLAKETLCTDPEEGQNREWALSIDGRRSTHRLDAARFEALIAPLVERTIDICQSALSDLAVAPGDVKGVVLVGGSTRVPLVRRRICEFFGTEPLADIDPDQVVAVGAALQAEALSVGSDILLLDVTPLSLGLETMGGLVEKVIPRNSPVPVAKAQEFTTFKDGQTAMSIHVVQGERESVDQNRSLARFDLQGIPPMTAGAARIKVTFAIDADGLLTVSAMETTTGVEQRVEVKPSYGLSDEDMAEMLREAMVNAEADMALRLLSEARVEGERALLAVEAALAADGDLVTRVERANIDAAMIHLREALSGEDRELIAAMADALENATKPFAEKRMDRGIRDALKGVSVADLQAET